MCIDASLSPTYRSLIPSDIHAALDISHPNQVLIGLEIKYLLCRHDDLLSRLSMRQIAAAKEVEKSFKCEMLQPLTVAAKTTSPCQPASAGLPPS